MANNVVLNPEEHIDLCVDLGRGIKDRLSQMSFPVFMLELKEIHKEYPILISYDEKENGYFPVALTGFEKGENLFMSAAGDEWLAGCRPLISERGPFTISRNSSAVDGQENLIAVDLDDECVGAGGSRLFTEIGGNTNTLDRVVRVLGEIHESYLPTRAFFKHLSELNLIVPISLEFDISEDEKYALPSFFSIDEKALYDLSDSDLLALTRSGGMNYIVFILSSLSNIQGMLEKKAKLLLVGDNK